MWKLRANKEKQKSGRTWSFLTPYILLFYYSRAITHIYMVFFVLAIVVFLASEKQADKNHNNTVLKKKKSSRNFSL